MKRAAQTMAITNSAASFGKKQRPKSTLTWQKLQWRGAGSWEEFLFVKCLGSFLLLEKAKPQLPFSFGQGSQKESWHSFLMLAYPQNIIGNNFSQQHRGWRTCSVFLSKAWKCCALTWSCAPGAVQSCGRRTPLRPHYSTRAFLLHASLSQPPWQAHLLLLTNKSSDIDTNCGQIKIWGICLESGKLTI